MWQMSRLVWSLLQLAWLPLPSSELILSQVLSTGGCSELFTWDKPGFNDTHFQTSLTLAKQRETETKKFQSWMHAQQPGSLTCFRGGSCWKLGHHLWHYWDLVEPSRDGFGGRKLACRGCAQPVSFYFLWGEQSPSLMIFYVMKQKAMEP